MKYPDRKLGRPRKGVTELPKSDYRTIIAKFDGECSRCGRLIPTGEWAEFNVRTRAIYHQHCKRRNTRQT